MTDDHASAKARRVQLRTAILTPAQFGVRRSTSGRLARTRLTTEYGTADNSGNSTAPSNLSRSACTAGGGDRQRDTSGHACSRDACATVQCGDYAVQSIVDLLRYGYGSVLDEMKTIVKGRASFNSSSPLRLR
jgi:hypothetical protein